MRLPQSIENLRPVLVTNGSVKTVSCLVGRQRGAKGSGLSGLAVVECRSICEDYDLYDLACKKITGICSILMNFQKPPIGILLLLLHQKYHNLALRSSLIAAISASIDSGMSTTLSLI